MEFHWKFLIFAAFIVVAHSRSISEEKVFELQDTNCSCDWRFFKHYETKGCIVETVDSCGCPQKFICPSNLTQQADAKVCIYQNKEYKVGSKIISSDICQVCRCRNGVPPYISCVTRECPEIRDKPGQDCHLIYKEDKCCPVDIECFKNETEVTNNKTCEYDGKLYPFGTKIYPLDDPCQTCICDENWNNGDNSSNCHQQECMFEKNKSKLDEGCIPVYHESRCCPVEFYCPSSHNLSYSVLSSNESSDSYNTSLEDQCTFAGQSYALGEELFIGNPCVKCSCLVPPDFTCVHQTCPPSPSEENCFANYKSLECCPTYECMLADAESHPDGCPTPQCEHSGCRIEVPPGRECPTCVCNSTSNPSELEHNNLEVQEINQHPEQQINQYPEQQINQYPEQQINQYPEQSEYAQQVLVSGGNPEDYPEDELQMMPIRMPDSDGQISVMEKMILPELENMDQQYPEELTELEDGSFEDDFSTEAVNNIEENPLSEEGSSQPSSSEDLRDSYNESISDHPEKVVQKRSNVSDAANSEETKIIPVQQEQTFEEVNEDIEREGEDSGSKNTSFDDELENLRNRIFVGKNLTINEIISINHVVKGKAEAQRAANSPNSTTAAVKPDITRRLSIREVQKDFIILKSVLPSHIQNHKFSVPPGCPTPMCEGPWCRIGILPGEKCPTCICKRPSEP